MQTEIVSAVAAKKRLSDRQIELARMAHKEHQTPISALADWLNVSYSTIRRLINKPLPPDPEWVELVAPVEGFFPHSQPIRIRDGDQALDLVSNLSGIDDHPKLKIRAGELPAPEPRRSYKPDPDRKGGRS